MLDASVGDAARTAQAIGQDKAAQVRVLLLAPSVHFGLTEPAAPIQEHGGRMTATTALKGTLLSELRRGSSPSQ